VGHEERGMPAALEPSAALRRFSLLYATLALLAIVGVVVFWNALEDWWIVQFQAPGLQERFGFRVEYRQVLVGEDSMRLPVITDIRKGGYFDRLGVRTGDVVYCNHHGEGDFWGGLMYAEAGYRAHVKLLPADSIQRGCDGYRWVDIRLEDIR
jgi:hypothetical protein